MKKRELYHILLIPTIVSKIVSAYGIYTKAFYAAAGLAAVGIILSGIYQKLNKK